MIFPHYKTTIDANLVVKAHEYALPTFWLIEKVPRSKQHPHFDIEISKEKGAYLVLQLHYSFTP